MRGIQERTREEIAKITMANSMERDPRNIIARLGALIRYIRKEEDIADHEKLGTTSKKVRTTSHAD